MWRAYRKSLKVRQIVPPASSEEEDVVVKQKQKAEKVEAEKVAEAERKRLAEKPKIEEKEADFDVNLFPKRSTLPQSMWFLCRCSAVSGGA